MSRPLDSTFQFLSNCAVFVLSEAAAYATRRIFDHILSKSSINQSKTDSQTLSIASFNMSKWENGSTSQSSGSSNSTKSIGDKWKSIIGRVSDEPLLEDEDVPEEQFYESSPDINRFKSVDSTLLEAEPKWRCVSDESFLKMEQMMMSPAKTPLKRITENLKEVDVTNLISFSPCIVIKSIKNDESSTADDNDYETCESGESRVTNGRKTSLMSYTTCNSGLSQTTNAKASWNAPHYNTLDDVDTLINDEVSDLNSSQSSAHTKDISLTSTQPSETDECPKFNDTLEEMEHLIKYGVDYMVSSDFKEDKPVNGESKVSENRSNENKIDFNQACTSSRFNSDSSNNKEPLTFNTDDIVLPKHDLRNYRDHVEIRVQSPLVKKKATKKTQKDSVANKENKFHLRSPRLVVSTASTMSNVPTSSIFTTKQTTIQPPKKTPVKPRKFFYDTPPKATPPKITPSKTATPLQYTPGSHTPSKYTNIMSPIQYYIKNSPVVPRIQNVSPGVNLWERQSHKAAAKPRLIESPKENITPLKEKAYQQPKTTRMIEVTDQRLPKNFKVGLMAKNLPKPTVIKHQHREGTTESNEKHSMLRQNTFTMRGENSYGNLNVLEGDVSVCIEKPAVRTHTLK